MHERAKEREKVRGWQHEREGRGGELRRPPGETDACFVVLLWHLAKVLVCSAIGGAWLGLRLGWQFVLGDFEAR